jgi:DNA-binding protein H-NS
VAKSLAQVNAQIAKLQREADALKARKAEGVIARIREAIEQYGLTAADLGLGSQRPQTARVGAKPAAKKARRRAGPKSTAGIVKYRDEAGHTWTGHGRAPNWYKAALASGRTPESLLAK